MKAKSKKIFIYPGIILILCSFSTGYVYSQEVTGTAGRNTWYTAGLFDLNYQLPREEADYTEEGTLTLNINPRVLLE